MKNISIEQFTLSELKNPKFVKPFRIDYVQNGVKKTWEAVDSFDSVAILLYHTTKKVFVLVKQFRPPVYLNHKEHPFTYELCAGIIDKNKSLEEIAQEEIEEECGYRVPLNSIQKITSFFTNVGVSGGKQYLYFAQVNDDLKVSEGGGINDEQIELEYLDIKQANDFIFDESKAKTPGLMFAFNWFFQTQNNS